MYYFYKERCFNNSVVTCIHISLNGQCSEESMTMDIFINDSNMVTTNSAKGAPMHGQITKTNIIGDSYNYLTTIHSTRKYKTYCYDIISLMPRINDIFEFTLPSPLYINSKYSFWECMFDFNTSSYSGYQIYLHEVPLTDYVKTTSIYYLFKNKNILKGIPIWILKQLRTMI